MLLFCRAGRRGCFRLLPSLLGLPFSFPKVKEFENWPGELLDAYTAVNAEARENAGPPVRRYLRVSLSRWCTGFGLLVVFSICESGFGLRHNSGNGLVLSMLGALRSRLGESLAVLSLLVLTQQKGLFLIAFWVGSGALRGFPLFCFF